MEDMARLAVVEQLLRNNKNSDTFCEFLRELLYNINLVIDDPSKSHCVNFNFDLSKFLHHPELMDYLNYIGLQRVQDTFRFPKEQSLDKLKMTKNAIERKLNLCSQMKPKAQLRQPKYTPAKLCSKKYKLSPVKILKTSNQLLLEIEKLFNRVLTYEDEALQEEARNQIPLPQLQINALKRMSEHQMKIKKGESNEKDLSYELALLLELMGWFRHSYFKWFSAPLCEGCGTNMKFTHSYFKALVVERYDCQTCDKYTEFPRYNDVRKLMQTRQGRCGEWANCLTLFCRALGYDTRYVFDNADHVWCEVYDFESGSWLHVDPCEGALDRPLLYCVGWGKRLGYVLAASRDDLQDVTWRYTTQHTQVMSRRTACSEQELLGALLSLRAARQAQVSAARRRFLAARTLRELVQMMVERKPSEYESQGRLSGSKEWRLERGEIRENTYGHVFEFHTAGDVTVQYYTTLDRYEVSRDTSIEQWDSGVYECENIFRKTENDWHQVYLAREDGDKPGKVSWKLLAKNNLSFTSLEIQPITAIFENGDIKWTVRFDDESPSPVCFNETPTKFKRRFKEVVITATLSGGRGHCAWQHAQLFRQSLASKTHTFQIKAHLIENQ